MHSICITDVFLLFIMSYDNQSCVICRVLVLTFAAVFLAYKLIHLQALIDAYTNVMAIDVKFADTIHR